MSEKFHEMIQKDVWRAVAFTIYLIICIFDFIIVPSWIGLTRVDVAEITIYLESFNTLPMQTQLEIIKSVMHQHDPFTLKGGGLFHLSFGAILTGSMIRKD